MIPTRDNGTGSICTGVMDRLGEFSLACTWSGGGIVRFLCGLGSMVDFGCGILGCWLLEEVELGGDLLVGW